MTSTPALLAAAQIVPAAQATAFTADAGGKGALIDKATLVNYSAAVVTVSVSIVPLAGAVSPANTPVKASIAAGTTYLCPELVGKFMAPGSFVSWIASAGASVGGEINGRTLA